MASRSKRKASFRTVVHESCPIRNTHRRLESAHRLWHEALNNYEDPDGFRTFLNSAIQELRNVTFVLQKERFSAPGFDEWYAAWRKRLGESDAARWIVDLRNKVVKEGDLDTASLVHVRLLRGYVEAGEFVPFEGPPTASCKEIAVAIAATAPHEVREDGILVVERRWELPDLPGRELLEALASVYGLLSALVSDAHVVAGGSECGLIECDKSAGYAQEFLAGRPACMSASQEARTSVVDLKRGRFYVPRTRTIKKGTKKDLERLRAKYESKSAAPPDWKRIKDLPLRDQARHLHEVGVQLLRADGYLVHTFHLLRDGKLVRFIGVPRPDEKTDLHVLMWQAIRPEVERTRADALISSNEIWLGTGKSGVRPAEDPNRREAVHTVAADKSGVRFALTTLFRREPTGIILERVSEEEQALIPFLEAVFDCWRTFR
ncbi:hypothetical protein A2cp1_0023 [Anaeromyxobacter dehalogenans 2CP-1]|uniref:Uncharacterized protein n=1 Tax=Anaeromyxobacter dehalogenans (strain ATCC BAA-258 / DSM 21875 / 2CP-1) TaxID=455488 RepID=B8J703_ANAD2|nr:hypothetical protein [Anaeromyxobacter dehalogenans]ACL63384.1 hypothetical protein A2cp1_0023 [Anaeromyxobacter dehalogenans 2CP-1]